MDLEIARWLGTPAARALLMELPEYREKFALGQQTTLREQGLSAGQAAALLQQKHLQARAENKFGQFAMGMLFTSDGLEQASRLEVAASHAQRFASASLATVHDLGCGIGSDAMAMSALGITVHGVDLDPVTATLADINLRPWPDSRARVGLAASFTAPADAARSRIGVWFDPARRTPGVTDARGRTRRTFRLEEMSPSWDFVLSIAASVDAVGCKLSPSLPFESIPAGAQAQWVSWGGDLVEAVLWFGSLAGLPGRAARIIGPRGHVDVDESMGEPVPSTAGSLSSVAQYLYEADRAVVQAGLVGALTTTVNGVELESGLGYVTSPEVHEVDFARRYRVIEAMPFRPRALREWLRERSITGATIKKRGMRLDENALRQELKLGTRDQGQATLLLTRVAGEQAVLVLDTPS